MTLRLENVRGDLEELGAWLDEAIHSDNPDYQRASELPSCIERGCLVRRYAGTVAIDLNQKMYDRLALGRETSVEDGTKFSIAVHQHRSNAALAQLVRKTIHIVCPEDSNGGTSKEVITRTRELAVVRRNLIVGTVDVSGMQGRTTLGSPGVERTTLHTESSRQHATISDVEQVVEGMRLEIRQALEARPVDV